MFVVYGQQHPLTISCLFFEKVFSRINFFVDNLKYIEDPSFFACILTPVKKTLIHRRN